MIIQGRVWKFGDDIDTDVIIPAHYLSSTDPDELARHCMEPVRPDFYRSVRPGDIIVAGRNFGCGSSREHAALAIKGCHIAGVVAASFARIFFRNAINIGLPVIEAPMVTEELKTGDRLSIDLDQGELRSEKDKVVQRCRIRPFPGFLQSIIKAGGLMEFQKNRTARKRGRAWRKGR